MNYQLIPICIAICLSAPAMAQNRIAEYGSAYLEKTYAISIGEKGYIWVATGSVDMQGNECGFLIASKHVATFRMALLTVRDKYAEWAKQAVEKNVDDVVKDIPVEFPRVACYFLYGDYQFSFGQKLSPQFIVNSGMPLLSISTGKLTSSSNQFMHNDGLLMMFSSTEEVTKLHAGMDLEKGKEVLKHKQAQQDLFK